MPDDPGGTIDAETLARFDPDATSGSGRSLEPETLAVTLRLRPRIEG